MIRFVDAGPESKPKPKTKSAQVTDQAATIEASTPETVKPSRGRPARKRVGA